MSEMPSHSLQMFVEAFRKLPQRIVWQWPSDKQPTNITHNILLLNWLPQQDLLGHPKCRVFMTHGGLLSTQEAIYHGVPVLGLPFINDQLLNMNRAVRDGYALQILWSNINPQILSESIDQLINDKR